MKKYFIHNDSSPLGPFTIDELKDMEITKYTPVWCEGLGGWTPAARVKELESLWSDGQPFVYYAAPPPAFDKTAYDTSLKDGAALPPRPVRRRAALGTPLFWSGLALLVLAVIGALAFRYHSRTVDQTYAAALEQRKWEDSINRTTDTQRVQLSENPAVDNTGFDMNPDRNENAKNYARMNIERYVRCAKSFDAKRFGGIKDVKLVFYNNSDFTIDRAEFIVAYVKANGDVFERQNVTVANVPPHSKREATAPDEKRGTDVQCKLAKITSGELGLSKNVAVIF